MSFGGNLEDLPIVDLLQLLHATKKSGTLKIRGIGGEASISLNRGFIVSATHPNKEINIGSVLVENNFVSREMITAAVAKQNEAGSARKPLLATLIEMGAIAKEPAFKGLRKLMEKTIGELVQWKAGEFVLNVEDISLADDYRYFPETLRQEISVDTQSVLMTALKIFDERNNEEESNTSIDLDLEEEPTPVSEDHELFSGTTHEMFNPHPNSAEVKSSPGNGNLTAESLGLDQLDQMDDLSPRRGSISPYMEANSSSSQKNSLFNEFPEDTDDLDALTPQHDGGKTTSQFQHVALIFSEDGVLKDAIREMCLAEGIETSIYGVEKDFFARIKNCLLQEVIPIILMDSGPEAPANLLSDELFSLLIKKTKNLHPEVPVIQFVPNFDYSVCAKLFSFGVRAIIPRPTNPEALKDFIDTLKQCFHGIFQEEEVNSRHLLFARNQLGYLKRKIQLLRFPEKYVDVSLGVLEAVSENLERAMIFLVRKDDLIGVGSFGMHWAPEDVLLSAMKIKVPLGVSSLFETAVLTGEAYHGDSDQIVKECVFSAIGEPKGTQILILPLRANNKTIAVIYGDFGPRLPSALQVDALEILAAEAGLILENMLLKKQLEMPTPTPGIEGDTLELNTTGDFFEAGE